MNRRVLVAIVLAPSFVVAQPGDPALAPAAPAADPPAETVTKGPNHDPCLAALTSMDPTQAQADDATPCLTLAFVVRDKIRAAETTRRAGPPANLVEPAATDTVGTQDTAGQSSAVASGEPVAQSGGTIGLSGTPGSGLSLIAALAVNPIGATASEDDYKRYAWGSRAVDLSIVVPVNLDATGVIEEGLQYLGGHIRLNVPWLLKREDSALVKEAEQAFGEYLGASQEFVERVDALLTTAPDPTACAKAIVDGSADQQRTACGEIVASDKLMAGFVRSSARLKAAREAASKFYLTIEARADLGDVNLDGADPRDSLLAAYVSGGFRRGNTQLRGRGGIGTFNDGATDTGRALYYGALGLDVSMDGKDGRLALSIGIEGQTTSAGRSSPTGTRFANGRIGIRVPLAEGKAISIGIAQPLDDFDKDPIITIDGDWASLFGAPKE